MDFSFNIYKKLLKAIKSREYSFSTFEEFVKAPEKKHNVVLRHDVDRKPLRALKMAQIEHEFGVKSTYFFRIVKEVWNPNIISEVVSLGHEASYHYEDLTIKKGNHQEAIKHFEFWLKRIREFYPSKTICMHGSPVSIWDNRSLWDHYNYKDYGIIAEPYFDVDYNDLFYITDTGRSWNNRNISVRDHVETRYSIPVNSTQHMIDLIVSNQLPDKIMINTHPHRWSSNIIEWSSEYMLQNIKNQVKKLIILKNAR